MSRYCRPPNVTPAQAWPGIASQLRGRDVAAVRRRARALLEHGAPTATATDAPRRRARQVEDRAASSSSSPPASSRAIAPVPAQAVSPAPAPVLPDEDRNDDHDAAEGANYRGVSRERTCSKWLAQIRPSGGKIETLGRFDTKVEAARAYDRRART